MSLADLFIQASGSSDIIRLQDTYKNGHSLGENMLKLCTEGQVVPRIVPCPAVGHTPAYGVVQAQRHELNCSRRALGYFTLIGDRTLPTARDSSKVARTWNLR